jgi:predicted patatin/cPLA2 family phospholipase
MDIILKRNMESPLPPRRSRLLLQLLLTGVAIMVFGCAMPVKRNPVPPDLAAVARIEGYENIRFWGDQPPPWMNDLYRASPEEIEAMFHGFMGREQYHLAISGGASKGAFGAGLLNGWSASGTRPEFSIVTGISTGALIAPFAFAGPGYDKPLKEAFTTISDDDIFDFKNPFSILTGEALARTGPLKAHIAKFIDQSMMKRIAAEHRKGRRLFISTTHLDLGRPMVWNIGEIAASGQPGALDLIHSVMLASASLPVFFSPVLFNVKIDGKQYDEMHVDGGITHQVFLYPFGIDWQILKEKLNYKGNPSVYIIRNDNLESRQAPVERRILPIANRSLDTLIRRQGIGDETGIFLTTRQYGLDFNLAYIPDSFQAQPASEFDRKYMKKLFDLGYDLALKGYPWEKSPPYYRNKERQL